MANELETETFFVGDDPHFSICEGHVTPAVFSKAHEAEGWSGDPIDEVAHEYLVRTDKPGDVVHFEKASPDAPNAKPYTVMYW